VAKTKGHEMNVRLIISVLALCATTSGLDLARAQTAPRVDPDGTLHLPAMTVPLSNFLSPEAKAIVAQRLNNPDPVAGQDITKFRAEMDVRLQPLLDRQRTLYPVGVEKRDIGGVTVYAVTPRVGLAPKNRDRVLINLHGGAFTHCAPMCELLESIPIAGTGRILVLAVDYRQGPKNHFPAASEDVATVYRTLLKHYLPMNIGIFGCSAGGILTAESLAWFQAHKLPRPGAVGILCASAGGWGGDAAYLTPPLDGRETVPFDVNKPAGVSFDSIEYFRGADTADPLVQPLGHAEVMRRFPPTLLLTGTRSFDLSGAIETHRVLTRLGVTADLQLWDGLYHSFQVNPDMPESKEAYAVIVRFFDLHLGAPQSRSH